MLDVDDHLPLTTVAFEILLAVGERETTGYEVMLAIEARTAGRLNPNPGTLYRAIDRLVGDGLIEVTPTAGGGTKPRRRLSISELGRAVLAAESDRLAAQIDAARSLGASGSTR